MPLHLLPKGCLKFSWNWPKSCMLMKNHLQISALTLEALFHSVSCTGIPNSFFSSMHTLALASHPYTQRYTGSWNAHTRARDDPSLEYHPVYPSRRRISSFLIILTEMMHGCILTLSVKFRMRRWVCLKMSANMRWDQHPSPFSSSTNFFSSYRQTSNHTNQQTSNVSTHG